MRQPKLVRDKDGNRDPLVRDLELLRDVRTAMRQIECGKGVANRDAKAYLRRRLRAI